GNTPKYFSAKYSKKITAPLRSAFSKSGILENNPRGIAFLHAWPCVFCLKKPKKHSARYRIASAEKWHRLAYSGILGNIARTCLLILICRRPHSDEDLSRRTLPTLAKGLTPPLRPRPLSGAGLRGCVRRGYLVSARAPEWSRGQIPRRLFIQRP